MKAVTAYESEDGMLFRTEAEAAGREARLTEWAANAEKIRAKEATIPTFTPEQAFEKMNAGVWMTCGGFTLRNGVNKDWGPHFGREYGEYWAYGDYPSCRRTSDINTLSSVRSISPVWREAFGPDGKIQWPVKLEDCQ